MILDHLKAELTTVEAQVRETAEHLQHLEIVKSNHAKLSVIVAYLRSRIGEEEQTLLRAATDAAAPQTPETAAPADAPAA